MKDRKGHFMDITVIGASGSVGREIVHLIVADQLLSCDQRLILVGNPQGTSAKSLFGFAADIMDAYAETSPRIEVVMGPEEIRGDVIIMAAGATIPVDLGSGQVSRDGLGEKNIQVYERYASALAQNGHGYEIVLCVSNPNELAVTVFAKHLGRKRVIGMGAFLDSMRFREEIAIDLGIKRQRIHGFMVGEHGPSMVPLWSSIHIYGISEQKLEEEFIRIRKGHSTDRFHEDVQEAVKQLKALIAEGRIRQAYEMVSQYPPDIRVTIKPFVTHFSGSKTVIGTARATVELIRMITLGSDALISGQICLEGEFHGIHSTLGVPFVVGNQGVDRIIELDLSPAEKTLLLRCAESVRQKMSRFL